jgi:xanthine dehydrogenase YagR molybdenum-binding subunit
MSIAAPEPKANMGQPIPRYDAVAKVTGKAQYGADVALVDPVYAFLVTSSSPRDASTGSIYQPPNSFAAWSIS